MAWHRVWAVQRSQTSLFQSCVEKMNRKPPWYSYTVQGNCGQFKSLQFEGAIINQNFDQCVFFNLLIRHSPKVDEEATV
jgi:hypothetical protein